MQIAYRSDHDVRLKEAARDLLAQRQAGTIDRRGFLSGMAVLLACAGAGPAVVRASPANETGRDRHPAEFWPTIAAVQAHLFPTTQDAPGAVEINATAYLKAVLVDPRIDQEEQDFISGGVALLNDFTRKQKDAAFAALSSDEREEILRRIENSPVGQYWLSLMIYYIFEALLVDPVYGGNPDAVGWRWLEHKPGFPRPPLGHRYYEL